MSDGTKIEWTDATANVINGCSVISPGCTNCYAMRLAGTRMRSHPTRAGLTIDTKAGPVWNGQVRFNEKALMQVLSWTRPRMIFWNAHGDLFHESVPDEWIDRCFAAMALTPQHKHQVLTKRSARMRAYFDEPQTWDRVKTIAINSGRADVSWAMMALMCGEALPNVWLGVSVEDQARAAERIPDLLATPAAVRWISAEPLLGPLDLNRSLPFGHGNAVFRSGQPDAARQLDEQGQWCASDHWLGHIKWVVAGGESGPGARPMHPDWARSLRDQCAAAGVPFMFKQFGQWLPVDSGHPDLEGPGFGKFDSCAVNEPGNATHVRVGKRKAGRLLDGVLHDGYPA